MQENLPAYTKLFLGFLNCSAAHRPHQPQERAMVFRVAKVFTAQPGSR